MSGDFFEFYRQLFLEFINCNPSKLDEVIPVGVTRTGELDAFVDQFMQDWTQQADSEFSITKPLTPDLTPTFNYYRFCTYSEFEELHNTSKIRDWNGAIFRMLQIIDEQKQNEFNKKFPKSRDGYFNLMEMVNPQMRTFFFQAVQYCYT